MARRSPAEWRFTELLGLSHGSFRTVPGVQGLIVFADGYAQNDPGEFLGAT